MPDLDRPTETYIFDLLHDGAIWPIYIQARSEADARERMMKMPLATYVGVHKAKLPLQISWFGKLTVWARNRARRWYA